MHIHCYIWGRCIDSISIKLSLIFLFSTGRKQDETDEKFMQKERERAQKEREKEERGKETQMLIFPFVL